MANKVVFTFIAQDKFNRVAREMNRLTATAKQNFRGLATQMRSAGQRLDELARKAGTAGKKLKDVGKDIFLRFSAAAGGAVALALRNFDKQAVAIAKVQNSIRSTGGAAGLSLKQLTEEASKLQERTLFGDETILNDATAQLLTFTNIAGDNFLKTQEAALNLATMLDGDLKSASIQLGKALNDPVANLSALSRSGIQFTKDQKAVINALAQGGRLADAQALILRELEKQYGGTAEAAAKSGIGPAKQAMMALGDATEEVGKILADILRPMFVWIKNAAQGFGTLAPWVKKTVAVVLLLVTVLGPLVIALGAVMMALPLISAGFAALGAVAAALATPFLLIPLAIAAVVAAGMYLYKNFEGVRKVVDAVAGAIVAVFDAAVTRVKSAIETVTGIFTTAQEFARGIGEWLGGKAFAISHSLGFDNAPATSNTSRTDVNVNLRGPAGAVESVKSTTRGSVPGMNVGVNMATVGG